MRKISLEDAVLFFIKNSENLEKYYIKLYGHSIYLAKKSVFLRYCRFFGLTFGYTKRVFQDAVVRIIIHCKQTCVDSDQLIEKFIENKNFDMVDKNSEIKIALQHILYSNKGSTSAIRQFVQTPSISNFLPINPYSAHKLLKIPRFQEAPSIPLIEMIEAELDEYTKKLESLASYICTEKLKKNRTQDRARDTIANEFFHFMTSIKDSSLKILTLYKKVLCNSNIAVMEETVSQSEFQLEDLKAKLKSIESHLRGELRLL